MDRLDLGPVAYWRLRALNAQVRIAQLEAQLAAELAKNNLRAAIETKQAFTATLDGFDATKTYDADDATETLSVTE
jgi:hypothetical protein